MSVKKRTLIAKMGGKARSKNRKEMAKIGRKGGRATAKKPGFMSRIASLPRD